VAAIGLINYGSGNFLSVYNALHYLDLNIIEIDTVEKLKHASHLILPGVGAFGACMEKLRDLRFAEALIEHVLGRGTPFLGICVGMQVLADRGVEFTETGGLGFIPGVVEMIEADHTRFRLPHIGWNEVQVTTPSPLFAGMTPDPNFYFVHSFHFRPLKEEHLAATCDYGTCVTAAVQKDYVFGVQFHPEKSQQNGLQLLRNFARL
jgi:glutamine amidotransferase